MRFKPGDRIKIRPGGYCPSCCRVEEVYVVRDANVEESYIYTFCALGTHPLTGGEDWVLAKPLSLLDQQIADYVERELGCGN